jgi:hypothetical protein
MKIKSVYRGCCNGGSFSARAVPAHILAVTFADLRHECNTECRSSLGYLARPMFSCFNLVLSSSDLLVLPRLLHQDADIPSERAALLEG